MLIQLTVDKSEDNSFNSVQSTSLDTVSCDMQCLELN